MRSTRKVECKTESDVPIAHVPKNVNRSNFYGTVFRMSEDILYAIKVERSIIFGIASLRGFATIRTRAKSAPFSKENSITYSIQLRITTPSLTRF
jgi:hypothetical protein